MTAAWRRTFWKRWRATSNWPPIDTKGSGNAWIRCETNACSKACGEAAKRPGKYGSRDEMDGVISRPQCVDHRAHRLQGLLVGTMAEPLGRASERVCAHSAVKPEQLRHLGDRESDAA